jgi:hypothetical protein
MAKAELRKTPVENRVRSTAGASRTSRVRQTTKLHVSLILAGGSAVFCSVRCDSNVIVFGGALGVENERGEGTQTPAFFFTYAPIAIRRTARFLRAC